MVWSNDPASLWTTTVQEHNALIEQVSAGDGKQMSFTELRLAAEATGWYWFHLFETLRNDPILQDCPSRVVFAQSTADGQLQEKLRGFGQERPN
jgi:hypothetical protein